VIVRLLSRWLVSLFVLLLGWLLVRRLDRARRPRAGAAGGRRPAAPTDALVRDRVCNTFLPRSRALRVAGAGEDRFFCSTSCRDRFLRQGQAERASV
jgi:hypothetical protein